MSVPEPDWSQVVVACRQIPPSSALWDDTGPLHAAIDEIAEAKRKERPTASKNYAARVAGFLASHSSHVGTLLPAAWAEWQVTDATEAEAIEGSAALNRLDEALQKLSAAESALAGADFAMRQKIRILRNEAEEQIAAEIRAVESLRAHELAVSQQTAHVEAPAAPQQQEQENRLGDTPESANVSTIGHRTRDDTGMHPLFATKTSVREPLSGPILTKARTPTTKTPERGRPEREAPRVSRETETKSVATEPLVQLAVPAALVRYEKFRETHWIQPDGRYSAAPWLREDFLARVGAGMIRALKDSAYTPLWIFCSAAEHLGDAPLIEPSEVIALSSMWAQPQSAVAGSSIDRTTRLRAALERNEGAQPRWRVAAFLEALRPNLEDPLNPQELAEKTLFENDPLQDATLALLRLNLAQTQPLDRIRESRSTEPKPSRTDLESELSAERQRFQQFIRMQWQAANGRIQRTHCREAWRKFMEDAIQPIAAQLYPSANSNDHTQWKLDVLRRGVQALLAQHEKIADKADAKYRDRAAMDRGANEIVEATLRVLKLAADWREAGAGKSTHNHADLAPLRTLLECAQMSDPVEEACRRLFLRLVENEGPEPGNPLTFSPLHLLARPWLAPVFEREQLWAGGQFRNDVLATALDQRAILCAAAALLEPELSLSLEKSGATVTTEQWRQVLAQPEMNHLAPWFLGSGVFTEQEKTRVLARQTEQQGELESRLQELRSLWREIEDLGLPFATEVANSIAESALHLDDAEWLQREMPLFDEWLRAFADFLRSDIAAQTMLLRNEAALQDEETRSRVEAALGARRYADALELLQRRSGPSCEAASARETTWREDGETRWPEPLRKLAALAADSSALSPVDLPLLEHWQDRKAEARSLRRAFYDFLVGEAGDASTELRTIDPSQIRLHLPALLDRLDRQGLNPTFVPQLRNFAQLVIMSPAIASANPEVFASSLMNTVAKEAAQHHLAVFLAPRLGPAARDATLRQIRSRPMPAAVLDDLDLCRLFAPDGRRPNPYIGMIEILFEQMDWTQLQPFAARDGQFVQPEMFVGREQQARELATTMNRSRIFSGRKLGKSALLKHIEQSWRSRKLPSGQILRVLYLNCAGADTEPTLADRIIEAVRDQLFFEPPVDNTGTPGKRLAGALAAWTKKEPGDSLLVILDEADAFVERQIADYDQHREGSLSFAMMKSIPEQARDNRGLPRVRFVLAGYRATNRDAGVWANAGEVLRLEPLTEDEAVRLIEGPFARLNVDVREQAPAIARRCGFQPAVLLRFGESLLQHLHDHFPKVLRRRVQVTSRHVSEVFNSPRVLEEIRTVVSNNFQGNRAGAIIFNALLLCLRRQPPGTWLTHPAADLLEQLRAIDQDTGWLREIGPDETSVIVSALRDFHARRLVQLDDTAEDLRCQLRFPHYLPVLTREAGLESAIHQEIETLRAGAQAIEAGRASGPGTLSVTSLMPTHDLEDVRRQRLAGRSADWPLRAIVAGSHWLTALQHEFGGLPDRLGLASVEIIPATNLPANLTTLQSCAILNADRAILTRYCRAPAENAVPIFTGGADLLRAALEAEESGEFGLVIAYGLHRLQFGRVAWWFERLRAWQFTTRGALSRLLSLTSGIPILVGMVDEFLEARLKPGADVSGELFEQLESFLRDAPAQAAAHLHQAPEIGGLTARERQLLRMVVAVARNTRGFPEPEPFLIETALGTEWELYREEVPDAEPLAPTSEDRVAERFLRLTGLFPLDAQRRLRFRGDDALFHIAAAL